MKDIQERLTMKRKTKRSKTLWIDRKGGHNIIIGNRYGKKDVVLKSVNSRSAG